MARRRVPRPIAPDELRCKCTGNNGWRCLERRRPGSAMCERHHMLSCKLRPRAKSLIRYKRCNGLQIPRGATGDLQPSSLLSPPSWMFCSSVPPIQGYMSAAKDSGKSRTVNCHDQNSGSVVEDPSMVPVNAGTKEGSPIPEASVSAPPNLNRSPNPSSSPLGFKKTTSVWQAVEKLDVFGQVPQQPHFMKLQSFCPEMREGVALGLMMTYKNMADSIKTLSFDDDVAVILEKLVCLNPLEENGFDTDRFQARLRQLLQIQTEYMGSGPRLARLERQLAVRETNLASLKRVQLESKELLREIGCVKDRIDRLLVKRDQLLDQTVGNGHEISRLKEAISNLSGLDESGREEFVSLLTEPL